MSQSGDLCTGRPDFPTIYGVRSGIARSGAVVQRLSRRSRDLHESGLAGAHAVQHGQRGVAVLDHALPEELLVRGVDHIRERLDLAVCDVVLCVNDLLDEHGVFILLFCKSRFKLRHAG